MGGKCRKFTLGTGIAFICFGVIFGFFLFPHLLQKKIKQQIRLEKDGDLFNRWRNITIPIFMKVYFFNITNPKEFAVGEKPILEEVGPYIYQQKREKVVELIDTENDTVEYRPKITYFFRSDMSNCRTEEDVINFINVPFVSVATKALSFGMMTRSLIRSIIDDNQEQLFVQKKVGELLFKGYHVPMIKELSDLKGEEFMPNNTFGIYYGKNGTVQDHLEIFSGVIANERFGDTISWNGQTKLNFWDSEYCNMINGSDGSIFPPSVDRDRVLRIFSPDMCRSIFMTYVEDVELKGIPAYRFTTPKDVMQDPRINPDNICYCTDRDPEEGLGSCTKAGVFRIAACRKGAPIVASWPHFFDGDEEYQNQSIGLKPRKELHETSISLEPNTGALLQASKRFQINIELKPNRYFTDLKKIPAMILPLLWVDESVSLTEENAAMIQRKLLTPIKIGTFVMFGLYFLGALIIVIAFLSTRFVIPWREENYIKG